MVPDTPVLQVPEMIECRLSLQSEHEAPAVF